MNTETMERLLIDKRLGELPPDTAQLLDAYLAVNPDSAALAAEIDTILKLAGRALEPPARVTAEDLPPFPAHKAAARGGTNRNWGWVRPITVAAAIVLAFFLGTRTATSPQLAFTDRSEVIVPSANPTSSDEQFWSVNRYAARRRALQRSVEWNSPLFWPRIGERL